jgi:hypothetical protein
MLIYLTSDPLPHFADPFFNDWMLPNSTACSTALVKTLDDSWHISIRYAFIFYTDFTS